MIVNLKRLNGVHPDLITIMNLIGQKHDIAILEGVRTPERQKKLVARGSSKTMNSKHIIQSDGFAHAVDVTPFFDTDGDGDSEVSWAWPDYYPLAHAIKMKAKELGIVLQWGGDWKTFKDGPHWQLV